MGLAPHGPGSLPFTVLVVLDQLKALHALLYWLVKHLTMTDLNASAIHAPLCISMIAPLAKNLCPGGRASPAARPCCEPHICTACVMCDSCCEEQALLQTHTNCLSTFT